MRKLNLSDHHLEQTQHFISDIKVIITEEWGYTSHEELMGYRMYFYRKLVRECPPLSYFSERNSSGCLYVQR